MGGGRIFRSPYVHTVRMLFSMGGGLIFRSLFRSSHSYLQGGDNLGLCLLTFCISMVVDLFFPSRPSPMLMCLPFPVCFIFTLVSE